ncbi:MAG: hypothetical protein ACI85N_001944 [Gammaproteobacteria bacterium]|jgi:hypothetical protein
MKLYLFLFAISLYASSSFADDLDKQINNACLRHAVSLVAQLKSEVVEGMSQEQSDKALKIATTSCQAYFNKEFSPAKIAENVEVQREVIEKRSSGDALTDGWFETGGKKGNERLKRKQ